MKLQISVLFFYCFAVLCNALPLGDDDISHALFGALDNLSVDIATLSIIVIVFFVLAVELAFHYLGHITHDTPFESMIHSIEKELMIVGVMAFTFKIILTLEADILPIKWIIGLEFADLLVPVTAFFFCFQAILLIIMCIKQCELWSKGYHVLLDELLSDFYKTHLQLNQRILQKFYNFPLGLNYDAVEFRIFHVIFCDANSISKSGFEFDEYVLRVFEKILLNTLKIEIFDWILICILCSINWGRNALHLDIISCDHDSNDAQECEARNSIILFTLFGTFILAIVMYIAYFSRLFQLRLFRACGITKTIDYAQFLVNAEKRINGTKQLSDVELQNIVIKTKEILTKHVRKIGHGHVGHGKHGARDQKSLRTSCNRMISYFFQTIGCVFKSTRTKDRIGVPKSDKLKPNNSIINNKTSEFLSNRTVDNSQKNKIRDGSSFTLSSKDICNLYWFSNPELYFDLVEVMFMLIAFYNSLWIINFSYTAVLTHSPKFWLFISVLPGILSFILFIYVIKCSSILSAITTIDGNVLVETIEQAEDARSLAYGLRCKIIARLNERSGENPEDSLRDLFIEIDEDNSGKISRDEFQVLLDSLEISFSRTKWRIIFREIDRNFDNEISFDEMFSFLFPEHEISKSEKRKRLQLSRQSITSSALEFQKVFQEKIVNIEEGLDEEENGISLQNITIE